MASTHVARVSAGGVTNRRIAPSIYYTCSTAAGTAAKTITTDSTNKWTSSDLFEGLTIYVKFINSNSVSSPTLNIDSTGAKPIYRYGTTAPSTSAASAWNAGSVVGLTYDTTLNSSGCWVMHDWNNTTYSAMSQSEATTGTSTSSRLITAKVLNDTIDAKVGEAAGCSTDTIGSASAGTAISADDITAWTANTPTVVTKKTVVTGGSTTNITPVTAKTVVTSASGASAAISNGVLTITNGSFSTGDSVTAGTTVAAYTSLSTGDSVDVTAGTAASLSYTSRSIPNISVTSKAVLVPPANV